MLALRKGLEPQNVTPGDPELRFAGGIRGWQPGTEPEQLRGRGSAVLPLGAAPAAPPGQREEQQQDSLDGVWT